MAKIEHIRALVIIDATEHEMDVEWIQKPESDLVDVVRIVRHPMVGEIETSRTFNAKLVEARVTEMQKVGIPVVEAFWGLVDGMGAVPYGSKE